MREENRLELEQVVDLTPDGSIVSNNILECHVLNLYKFFLRIGVLWVRVE